MMEGVEIVDCGRWKKDDEEEALKWRRRGNDDERIMCLSMEEKRNLLNRLMNDNHNLLLRLRQRFNRYIY